LEVKQKIRIISLVVVLDIKRLKENDPEFKQKVNLVKYEALAEDVPIGIKALNNREHENRINDLYSELKLQN
jgi:hypothetical protein